MNNYTKTYLDYFGYSTADWIKCEIPECGRQAVDIHHIKARSKRKDLQNAIENLMALCRECHAKYGDKAHEMESLKNIHHRNLLRSKHDSGETKRYL